jgi:nitrate/nitrite transporter NarK
MAGLWWCGQVLAVTQIGLTLFAYLYLLEVVGLSAIAAGVFASNLQIAAFAGRLSLGWVTDATGRPRLVMAVLSALAVVAVVGLMVIDANSPTWAFVALALICGLAAQTWNPVFFAALSMLTPQDRLAEMNGRAFSFLSLGWMLGAPVFWALIELTGGYETPLLMLLAANLVVMTLLARARDLVGAR